MKTRPDQTTTEHLAWADVDGDGNSELLELGMNGPDGRINILNAKSEMMLSWHFNGSWCGTPRTSTGDFNHDGFPEISVFCMHNDSIVLRVWDSKTHIAERCLIALVPIQNGKPDFQIGQLAEFQDMNGDGSPELVFSVMAGYAKKPRKIMAYDYRNRRLIDSPDLGNMVFGMSFFNADADPESEIVLSTFAGANYPPNDTSTRFNDNRAWSMALDNNLTFLYPPVPVGQISTYLYQHGVKNSGSIWISLLTEHRSTLGHYPEWLRINVDGKIISSVEIRSLPQKKGYRLLSAGPDMINLLGYQDGNLYSIDTAGNTVARQTLGTPVIHPWLFQDLDQDGRNEQLFMASTGQQVIIFRDGFRHGVNLDVPSGTMEPDLSFGTLLSKGFPVEYVIQNGAYLYFFRYGRNPLSYLKYPSLLLSVLLFYLFVILIQQMQKKRTERRMQIEKDIQSLKLQTVRNQIDPHFAMNFLNNVNYLVQKAEPEQASRYLTRFSRLLQESLSGDQEITRTLENELDFVRNYLEIETLRYPEKFDYTLEIGPGVDTSSLLPAMNIQLFVENSLKHGIKPKQGKGSIRISVQPFQGYLVIEITDDGVGRKAAATSGESSTGRGLSILNTLYALYNQNHSDKIRYEVEDLDTESAETSGTRVRVWVPEGFSYE